MSEKQGLPNNALELIDYPNRFPLKVFGKQATDFEATVLRLIKARCPQAEHFEVSSRASKSGKYVALTITFTVYGQKQLKEIYQALYECDQVVMSL